MSRKTKIDQKRGDFKITIMSPICEWWAEGNSPVEGFVLSMGRSALALGIRLIGRNVPLACPGDGIRYLSSMVVHVDDGYRKRI